MSLFAEPSSQRILLPWLMDDAGFNRPGPQADRQSNEIAQLDSLQTGATSIGAWSGSGRIYFDPAGCDSGLGRCLREFNTSTAAPGVAARPALIRSAVMQEAGGLALGSHFNEFGEILDTPHNDA